MSNPSGVESESSGSGQETSYPSLKYHPYFSLCCVLNEEGTNTENNNLFYECVKDYRSMKLARNFGMATGKTGTNADQYPSYLYNTACHDAYGYADVVKLLLVEDVDPYFYLTTHLDIPISQISIGFCPKFESLEIPSSERPEGDAEIRPDHWLRKPLKTQEGVNADNRETSIKSPFVPLHDLFEGRSFTDYSSPFPFQCERPLLVYARLKLAGLAVLSQGLLQRRCLLRAIARRVIDCLVEIDSLDSEFDHGDLTVSFIDNQGTEELGLYIACTDYSHATLICQSILSMPHADIYALDLPDTEILKNGVANDAITGLFRGFDESDPNPHRPLYANHLFSSSYTVIGVAKHLVRMLTAGDPDSAGDKGKDPEPNADQSSGDSNTIDGLVEVYGRVNILAGHFVDAEKVFADFFDSPTINKLTDSEKLPDDGRENLRVLLGRYDYDYSLSWREEKDAELVRLKTVDFIRLVEELRARINNHPGVTEAILSLASGVVVPIPRINWLLPNLARQRESAEVYSKQEEVHAGVVDRLKEAVGQLFRKADSVGSKKPEKQKDATEQNSESLPGDNGNIPDNHKREAELESQLKRLRLPIRLRRSAFHLIKNLRDGLQDPMLYDSILDILHPYTAIEKFLDRDLKHYFNDVANLVHSKSRPHPRKLAQGLVYTSYFTNHLTAYLDALNNAYQHRVHRLTKFELDDHSIDFRGGLNQLVHCSNVPLICGVGLLKRCWKTNFFDAVDPDETWQLEDRRPDCRIGAVQELSLNQIWQLRRIKPIETIINTKQRTRLAVVAFSFGHVLNPLEYVDLIHEAAHLILDAWDYEEETGYRRLIRIYESNPLTTVYVKGVKSNVLREEFFCEAIQHVFMFSGNEDDRELASRFAMVKFNSQNLLSTRTTKSRGRQLDKFERDRVLHYLDYAIRIFYVTRDWSSISEDAEKFFEDCDKTMSQDVFAENLLMREFLTHELHDFRNQFVARWVDLDSWFGEENSIVRKWIDRDENEASTKDKLDATFREFDGFVMQRIFLYRYVFQREMWQRVVEIRYQQHYVLKPALRKPWDWDPKQKSEREKKKAESQKDGTSLPELAMDHYRDKFRQAFESGECMLESILGTDQVNDFDYLGIVSCLLSEFVRVMMGQVDEQKEIHVQRDEDGDPVFDPKKQYSPFMVEQLHGRFFSICADTRQKRCEWEIMVYRMLWDLSSRLRARRLKEVLEGKANDEGDPDRSWKASEIVEGLDDEVLSDPQAFMSKDFQNRSGG